MKNHGIFFLLLVSLWPSHFLAQEFNPVSGDSEKNVVLVDSLIQSANSRRVTNIPEALVLLEQAKQNCAKMQ